MLEPAGPLVLYVEDDRINIILVEEALRRLPGWRLVCVETGAEAMQSLQSLRPDLVLIDMNLPDMSGVELLRRLRAAPLTASLSCIALSADDAAESVEAALAAGFADYWLKPLDVRKLQTALRSSMPAGGDAPAV